MINRKLLKNAVSPPASSGRRGSQSAAPTISTDANLLVKCQIELNYAWECGDFESINHLTPIHAELVELEHSLVAADQSLNRATDQRNLSEAKRAAQAKAGNEERLTILRVEFGNRPSERLRQVVLERQALVDLFKATKGRSWSRHDNWNTSAPLSDWYGVICNGNINVTHLSLERIDMRTEYVDTAQGLQGTLNNLIALLCLTYLKDTSLRALGISFTCNL